MRKLRAAIYLEPDQREALDRLCAASGVRLTAIVRMAVDEWLKKHDIDYLHKHTYLEH